MQLEVCAGAFSRWVEAACELRAEREQAETAAQRATFVHAESPRSPTDRTAPD